MSKTCKHAAVARIDNPEQGQIDIAGLRSNGAGWCAECDALRPWDQNGHDWWCVPGSAEARALVDRLGSPDGKPRWR